MRKEITPQNTSKIFNLDHRNTRRQLFTGAELLFIFLLLPAVSFGQVVLIDIRDAYVDSTAPTSNFGGFNSLKVGLIQTTQGQTTTNNYQYSYVEFDKSSLPANLSSGDVTKATLKLYVNKVTVPAPNGFYLSATCTTFNESSVTWNSQPGPGCNNNYTYSQPVTAANQFLLLDVKPMISQMLSLGKPFSFYLAMGFGQVAFDSKESGGRAPVLELELIKINSITGTDGLSGGGNNGNLLLGIANGGVTTPKIADGAVISSKIANGAIGNTQLANNSVSTNNILPGAVNNLQLADNSVTSNKISVGAVTTNQLNNAAVTETKLADNSVTNTKITNGAVTETKLADGSITNAKIADSSIQAGKIGAGQVVKSLNGLFDNVNFVAGNNISLTPSGNSLTISSTSSINDSSLVHLAGNETITGTKTFQNLQQFTGRVGIGQHAPSSTELLSVGGNTGAVAGVFINNYNTSSNDALFAMHTGFGNAFRALNTQVNGRAGFFESSHPSTNAPALETLNRGAGPALFARNTGTGVAGLFEGNVTINGGLNITGTFNSTHLSSSGVLNASSNPVDWTKLKNVPSSLVSGQFVNSINGLGSSVSLIAGDNVTITPSGNTLMISASGGNSQVVQIPTYNTKQVALLRWYETNDAAPDISVGNLPLGVAFDGSNIWVVSSCNFNCPGYVSKIRTSDGVVLGTYPVGDGPIYAVYDGMHIWVSNRDSNNVTKLKASDGSVVGTYSSGGTAPHWMAFDGKNIWVTNSQSNKVAKLNARLC